MINEKVLTELFWSVWVFGLGVMASQNTINQRVGHRGFVTRIIKPVGGLLEEGKVQRLESVKRTLKEKMSLLRRLDDEILEALKEKQEIWNEIERSSDIRLNIQETIFQIDSKLKEISICEERSSRTFSGVASTLG